jgi:hypothetical protein
MTGLQIILIILGWAVAFRMGYVMGESKWRELFDQCMKSKTEILKRRIK